MGARTAVERDSELSLLRSRLQQTVDGRGVALAVTGPAGMGRSFVLDEVRRQAAEAGWTVVESRCTPTSTGLDAGLLHDWFDGLALRCRAGQTPFDGPATALIALARGEHVDSGALVYAVRRLLTNLSTGGPVLLLADDLQWADARSLQVLELLVGSLPQLACALVVGVRTGEPVAAAVGEPLRRLVAATEEVPLRAWSRQAVRDRVRAARRERAVAQAVRLAGSRSPAAAGDADRTVRLAEQADALLRRTGGVPFLVEHLLDQDGPDAPLDPAVVTAVAERLARLGDSASATARGVGVLGAYAELAAVADLTGTSIDQVADDVTALVEAQLVVVDGASLRLRQPVVGEALLALLDARAASDLHGRAAEVLTAHRAERADVARRLLHTLPGGDETIRARLREQGDRWLSEERRDLALRYYERAVAEGPLTEGDVDLMAALADLYAGAGRLDQALALWSRARELTTDPAVDRQLRQASTDALVGAGREREVSAEPTAVAQAAVLPATAQRRQARMALAGLVTGVSLDFLHQQIAPVLDAPPLGQTADERLSLVAAASVTAFEGRDAVLCRELVLRAVAQGLSGDDTGEAGLLFLAASVLLWTAGYVEAEALLSSAIADATVSSTHHRMATASVCRGWVRLRMGLIGQAQRDFETALEERAHGWNAYPAVLLAGLVECRLARGDAEAAGALSADLDALTHSPGLGGAYATYALAELAVAAGDHDRAAQLFAQTGRLADGRMDNPAMLPWRAGEALARIHLGQPRAAAHLAADHLALAERFGAPYAVAEALRTVAAVDPTGDRVALLRRALQALHGVTAARLEAQVATDLAGMLVLTGGGATEIGEPSLLLRRAESYAAFQELRPLADRVQRLLQRLGEPVRRTPAESIETLTASERRVAELAASGLSNRQIAQELFVTVKAVEWHLSNTYRKLGIRSRHRLSAILESVT